MTTSCSVSKHLLFQTTFSLTICPPTDEIDLPMKNLPELPPRQKYLPSEDEVTNTILSLLDPSLPGVSTTNLAQVLGRCRICAQYASWTALLGHQCGGRGEFAEDPYDANAYYVAHLPPSD